VEKGEDMVDNWIWRDAVFFVKVAYNSLKGDKQFVFGDFFVDFWKLKTLPLTQVTTWRVLTNTIATKDNLL